MMSMCDQIERALDSLLDRILIKTLGTLAWLLNIEDSKETSPVNIPDIVKDLNKAKMTFLDFQPDLLSTPTIAALDGMAKRCKSMDNICGHHRRTNSGNNNSSNTNNKNFLNRSFDHIHPRPTPLICRQESYHGDTDIALEPHQHNKYTSPNTQHRQCHRCCSDPLPRSHQQQITPPFLNSTDETDNAPIHKDPPHNDVATGTPTITLNTPESSVSTTLEDGSESERIQRRATELIFRHFPEVQQSGELEGEGDEQLCHQIVSELKNIADNFDERHTGNNGLKVLQDTLNIDMKQLLPSWLRQGIGPAVLKTSLNLALQYTRF